MWRVQRRPQKSKRAFDENKAYQQRVDDNMIFKCEVQKDDLNAELYQIGSDHPIVQMKIRNYFLSKDQIVNWKIEDVAKDDNMVGKGSFGRVFKVFSNGGYLAVKIIEYKNKYFFFENLYQGLNEALILKELQEFPGCVRFRKAYFIDHEFAKKTDDLDGNDEEQVVQNCQQWFQNNIQKNQQSGNISLAIVLNFCDCTLQDLIDVRQEAKMPWSEQELCFIVHQLVETLIKINSLGICHRDIKPVNILYDNQKGLYVYSDWGEGRKYALDDYRTSIEKQALSKSIRGTPLYMSPELLQQRDITHRDKQFQYDPFLSDIYSLGIQFYNKQGVMILHMMLNSSPKQYQKQSVPQIVNLLTQQGNFRFLLPFVSMMINEKPEERIPLTQLLKTLSTTKSTRPNESICINYIQKRNNNEEDKILLMKEIAFGYVRFFNYKLAVEQFQKIIEICDQNLQDQLDVDSIYTHQEKSQLEKIPVQKKQISEVVKNKKLTPEQIRHFSEEKTKSLFELGRLHYKWSQYDEAKQAFEDCSSLIKDVFPRKPSSKHDYQDRMSNPIYLLQQCVTNLSNIYRVYGNYTKARDLLDEGLKLLEEAKIRNDEYYRQKIYLLNCMALLLKNLGHVREAEQSINVALSLAYDKLRKQFESFIYLYISLANIQEQSGDLEQSLANYKFCLKRMKERRNMDRNKNICSYFNNIARVFNRLKNFKKGKEYFQKAKLAYENTCSGNLMVQVQMNNTILYYKLYTGDTVRAMEISDRNAELLTKMVKINTTGFRLFNEILRAEILYSASNYEATQMALDVCQDLQHAIYPTKDGHLTQGDINLLRAQTYLRQCNLRQALVSITDASVNFSIARVPQQSVKLGTVSLVKQEIQHKLNLLLFLGGGLGH